MSRKLLKMSMPYLFPSNLIPIVVWTHSPMPKEWPTNDIKLTSSSRTFFTSPVYFGRLELMFRAFEEDVVWSFGLATCWSFTWRRRLYELVNFLVHFLHTLALSYMCGSFQQCSSIVCKFLEWYNIFGRFNCFISSC